MTIKEKLEQTLRENGMSPGQAEDVMLAVMIAPENKSMDGRWEEPADAYSRVLINCLWISVKQKAFEWIDANLPQAWYRPLFEQQPAYTGK